MCLESSPIDKHQAIATLDYFERMERYAALTNDYKAVRHFQECWCLLFKQFFGWCEVASYRLPVHIAYPLPEARTVTPKWHTMKYSRPARKVVAQVTEKQRGLRKGEYFTVTYDVLVCGHKITAKPNENGSNASRWRYCRECPPKQKDAAASAAAVHRAA